MFKKCFVSFLILWSWISAQAVPHDPFVFFESKKVKDASCSPTEIQGMPPARSQDSLPICYSFSSATIVQFQLCKRNPNLCDVNGRPKESKYVVSPLSMLSWTHTNTGKGAHTPSNHKNLQLFKSGGASDALQNATSSFVFMSESCYPYDQLANKYGRSLESLEKLKNLVGIIEKEYNKASTESGFCEDCLKGAALELGITSSVSELKDKIVLSKNNGENFSQYLREIMLDKCAPISFKPSQRPKFDMFPKKSDKDFSYDGLIGKIKDVLKTGNPLAFDGLCVEFDGQDCKTGHSVVISGYRKVCKDAASCDISCKPGEKCAEKTTCRDLVRVNNSWGADWQSQGEGGWVEAKELLSYVTKNKEKMENTLSWYY